MASVQQYSRGLHIYGSEGNTSGDYYLDVAPSASSKKFNITTRKVSDNSSDASCIIYFKDANLAYKDNSGGQTLINSKFATVDSAIGTNTTDIASNTASITANATNIATNVANLASEIANRTSADSALQTTIDANMSASGVLINNVATDLATEEAARISADQANSAATALNTTNLEVEIFDRTLADTANSDAIVVVSNDLAQEITDRTNAVTGLQTQITDLLNGSPENLNTLTEIVALLNAGDGTLTTALGNLQSQVDTQRTTADARLLALENAIIALQGN
jgi:hypothetical protein